MLKSATLGLVIVTLFAFLRTSNNNDAGTPDREAHQPPQTPDEARQLARKTPGFKNLQRIGLAFHGYHDIFRRFPPAVLYAPDGKTKYSWRVELLPVLKHYVDGIEPDALRGNISREQYVLLIKACGYDINEAWDSDANAEVLKKMPEVYRHPLEAVTTIESAYYAVTGSGTAFEEGTVSQYSDMKGWVASTLMIAESRSREPWTKPIDIRYLADATVPRFGGFSDRGSLVLTCDGAVHFLHEAISPVDFRSLITKDPKDAINIIGIPYE